MISNMENLNDPFFDAIDISKRPTEKTVQKSALTIEQEYQYGFSIPDDELVQMKSFNVNTFWSIGMSDPFPDEATVMEQDNQLLGHERLSIENLVYPKERYEKGILPL